MRYESERGLELKRNQTTPENTVVRFGLITSLRGLASAFIFFFHLALLVPAPPGSFPAWIWKHLTSTGGAPGVAVFFVLSGFVLPHSVRWISQPRLDGANFLLRRLVRLAPVYWVSLGVTIAGYYLASLFHDGSIFFFNGYVFSPESLLDNILFLQLHKGRGEINAAHWALVIELQFYLLFLVLFTAIKQLEATKLRHVYTSAVLLLGSISLLAGFGAINARPNSIRPVLYVFFLGTLAYWVKIGKVSSRWLVGTLAVVVVAGGLGSAKGSILDWDRGYLVASVGTALILLAAIKLNGLHNWLNWRPLLFLGRISYSLYLTHLPVQAVCVRLVVRLYGESTLSYLFSAFAACVCSVLVAVGLWKLVEQPTMIWSRSLSSRTKQKTEVTTGDTTSAEIG